MKKSILKWFLWFVAGFFVFFGARLIYGYTAYPDGVDRSYYEDDGFRFSVRNFASYNKMSYKSDGGGGISPDAAVPDAVQAGGMKYEKVGVARSGTDNFDSDEHKTRSLIKQHSILVQFEQSSGLKGRRMLHLGLGVLPDQFDNVIAQLRGIGHLRSIRVDKTDKTNEYRELRAKRISLEKTRDALVALKSRSGSVDEAVSLENRIFDIEEQLQSLGVKLGEFDTENEFCTVKFSLYETASLTIPFASRLKTAFEWTVKFYFGFMIVLTLGLAALFLVITITEKLRQMFAPKETNRTQPPQS